MRSKPFSRHTHNKSDPGWHSSLLSLQHCISQLLRVFKQVFLLSLQFVLQVLVGCQYDDLTL